MIRVPFVPSVPSYSMTVPIEGASYALDVRWNERAGAWYFDVRELDGAPIALGIKIVLGAYLGRQSNHPLFLSGTFVAHDTSRRKREAGLDDIGTRVVVLYATNDDARAAILAMRQAIDAGDTRS